MTQTRYFLPSEWHFQRCVLLSWPDETMDWCLYIGDIVETMVSIVEAITRYEPVIIVAQDITQPCNILQRRLSLDQMSRVETVQCPLNDTWIRDYGPITLLPMEEQESHYSKVQSLLLDFSFNAWGKKFSYHKDNEVTKSIAETGIVDGQIQDNNDFILEGGSIESDGHGTIFTTSQCLLSSGRNGNLTKMDIEEQLKHRLNAKRVVWLNYGRIAGDDTDGHIDTIVRVCPNDTLLYVKPEGSAPETESFKALEAELKALRTIEGKPYMLLPLPLPNPIYYQNERLPATYANFLVINNAVLVPSFQQDDNDKMAQRMIQSAFPDRDIIPIDSVVPIRQHGGIHCLTMQIPFF